MLENIGLISFLISAVSHFILILLLAVSWRKGLVGGYLLATVFAEIVWSVLLALNAANYSIPEFIIFNVEILRFFIWGLLLLKLFRLSTKSLNATGLNRLFQVTFTGAVVLGVLLIPLGLYQHILTSTFYIGINLVLAICCVVLIEQVYRNLTVENRWAIKYLCIGAGAVFAYDLYVYSDALLFESPNMTLWNARGIVNAMVVPMIAITVARMPSLSFDLFISRQVVFYFSGVTTVGIYLLVMAFGGYYIKIYGGSWGPVAQIAFLLGALIVLFVILLSGYTRAKLKLFLSTHFYKNKYDYREEWMALIEVLSVFETPQKFKEKIIHSMARLIECRGGVLFEKVDGYFMQTAFWKAEAGYEKIHAHVPLILHLEEHERILDVSHPAQREAAAIEIPPVISSLPHVWLLVPLRHHNNLVGFVALTQSTIQDSITWEDRDLLLAVGRQISSYLVLIKASSELAEAQQFSMFNRLSAYLVHDLKNQVSQLELITKNAKKHSDDLHFFQDVLLTVDNVSQKMKKMLTQLKKFEFTQSDAKVINVNQVLERVIERRKKQTPVPSIVETDPGLLVRAEPERFETIVENLIQNAQDATKQDGEVTVSLGKVESDAVISIKDTGVGMDEKFIRERLFRPFDTTKGNAGMGIGVFEAREFVKHHGGTLEVDSMPGAGTTFKVTFPIVNGVPLE